MFYQSLHFSFLFYGGDRIWITQWYRLRKASCDELERIRLLYSVGDNDLILSGGHITKVNDM